jgi:exodeoxyribonuclease V gamma subunit
MESLLLLLNKISQVSPVGVFEQEVIVVQNSGMQHWLNLAIAQERGISMNCRYALPSQYLWKLIRTIAGEEKVLEQSPYSREVLTWRIYALLATEQVVSDEVFISATQYWQGHSSSALKRYQLAVQLADLYEQYLIFRPHWLDAWQQGDLHHLKADFDKLLPAQINWQSKLWQLLISQEPYNPIALLNNAIKNLDQKIQQNPYLLPKRLSFFAINTMPPMWLNFINALSEYIEVDFFHLNPCYAYWGDIISAKQAHKKLAEWSTGADDEHLFVGNPLLANFGQQGREFLALLQDYSTVNVDLFVEPNLSGFNEPSAQKKLTILHQVQNDILHLEDATARDTTTLIDDSITITSCHSPLREVQALHDYLLHQFNDAQYTEQPLTPKDILVMCPQIEQYAPYVNAVFSRGWQNIPDELPPLPCSIADRSAKDSDPLIATFTELLALPESRFQVTHLLAFIRQKAIANKFLMADEDIDKISVWLKQASVHWGLDLAHKQKILGDKVNDSFTWQQGLSRLLRGFAFADVDTIYQGQLLLADVEGDDAILLGQLMLFIEQLQQFSQQLSQTRTPTQWQQFLLAQLELLFSRHSTLSSENSAIDNALTMIEDAICRFVEFCQHAHLAEKIELAIVTDYLNNHFSQGDTSRQFMVGQVTFCSMLPMRSIPFKVIAVLGLNDGEFPRQRQPLAFDLIAQSKAKFGDRSRRGDDRYLFLEAIISARQSLYLSYQGRNIKNNNEKQPSLVLKELMDYLANGYGWQFDDNQNEHNIHQIAMQPFSEANYQLSKRSTIKPSFDANWLKFSQSLPEPQPQCLIIGSGLPVPQSAKQRIELTTKALIQFYQHPSKTFAQHALNLYLTDDSKPVEDIEPFAADFLASYLLREDLLATNIQRNEYTNVEQVLQTAKLSGKFPDLPTMEENYAVWHEDSAQFAHEIMTQQLDNPELTTCSVTVELNRETHVELSASVPIKLTEHGVFLAFYRSSTAKPKDLFTLYVKQLIVCVWQQQNYGCVSYHENLLSQVSAARGIYFNTKSQKTESYFIDNQIEIRDEVTNLEKSSVTAQLVQLLDTYYIGLQQPLLVNANIGAEVFKTSRGKPVKMTQARFEQLWQGSESSGGFCQDAYLNYFWPQCPAIDEHIDRIESIYNNMYQLIRKTSGAK